jgi:hypothetical protein
MKYTGDRDDVCAISLIPVAQLKHPVGFEPNHAFDCESIVEWITQHRNINPITGDKIEHA